MPTRDDVLLRHEVVDFLHSEAALLDAQDFPGWLRLFAPDGRYWIPAVADEIDTSREVSIVDDDLGTLAERVWRFGSGLAYAQEPRSRTTHLVGNVQVTGSAPHPAGGDAIEVGSVFTVTEFRRGHQRHYAGRYRHRLHRGAGGEFGILLKKVELVDNDGHLGNVSLLL